MEDELDQNNETEKDKPTPPAAAKRDDALGESGKAAIVKERQAREAAEKKLKAFGDLTPEKVTELLKMKTDLETKQQQDEEAKLQEKGQYEALLLKNKQEHEKRLNATVEQLTHKDSVIKSLETQLAEAKTAKDMLGIQHETQAAFFGAKGKRGESDEPNFWFDVLWQKVGSRIKPGEDGKPEIVNPDGSLVLDDEKKPYTIAGFVAAQKAKLPALFERESEASGGGKSPGSTARRLQETDNQLTIKQSELKDSRNWCSRNKVDPTKFSSMLNSDKIKVIEG